MTLPLSLSLLRLFSRVSNALRENLVPMQRDPGVVLRRCCVAPHSRRVCTCTRVHSCKLINRPRTLTRAYLHMDENPASGNKDRTARTLTLRRTLLRGEIQITKQEKFVICHAPVFFENVMSPFSPSGSSLSSSSSSS